MWKRLRKLLRNHHFNGALCLFIAAGDAALIYLDWPRPITLVLAACGGAALAFAAMWFIPRLIPANIEPFSDADRAKFREQIRAELNRAAQELGIEFIDDDRPARPPLVH